MYNVDKWISIMVSVYQCAVCGCSARVEVSVVLQHRLSFVHLQLFSTTLQFGIDGINTHRGRWACLLKQT